MLSYLISIACSGVKRLAIVAFGVLAVSAAGHANDWSLSTWQQGPRSQVAYESSSISKAKPKWRESARRHRHRRAEAPRRHEPDARLYRPQASDGRKMRCLDRVTVVGSQWATEAGAEESAQKAFMESVRWSEGESFMDIENARDYARRCSRSSVGEVMNQTFHRCEISARPCRPVFEAKAGKAK